MRPTPARPLGVGDPSTRSELTGPTFPSHGHGGTHLPLPISLNPLHRTSPSTSPNCQLVLATVAVNFLIINNCPRRWSKPVVSGCWRGLAPRATDRVSRTSFSSLVLWCFGTSYMFSFTLFYYYHNYNQ